MHETTFLILVMACVAGLFILVGRGVVPKIAHENGLTAPASAWLDVWLPLWAALPMVLAVFFCREGGVNASEPRFAIWWAAGPATAVGGLALALSLIFGSGSKAWCRIPGIGMRHALPLLLLGSIITVASFSDRLGFRHGVILCVCGILWLWISTPGQDSTAQTAMSSARRKPVLIVDWAGALREPVSWRVKILAAMLFAAFAVCCRFSSGESLAIACLAAMAFQGALALMLLVRLGSRVCARSAGSTLILSVFLGLGAMVVSRLGGRVIIELFDPDLFIPWLPIEWYRPNPSFVQGMTSLRAAGVLLVGLGMVSLLSELGDRSGQERRFSLRSYLAALTIGLASILVAATGSARFVDAAGRQISWLMVRALDLQSPNEGTNSIESP